MPATVTVDSSSFDAAVDRVAKGVIKNARRIVEKEVSRAFLESQDLVPVDKGYLKGEAGRVFRNTPNGIEAEMFYGPAGGVSEEYAREVHYDDAMHHEVGRSRFLEIPTIDLKKRLPQKLKAAGI